MKELDLFLNTRRTVNTRKSYKRHLEELFEFKDIETIEDFAKLNIDDFYEWKNHLLDIGVAENSIRPKLSAISKFYEFLMKRPQFNINKNIIKDSDMYENTKKIVNPAHTTWLQSYEIDSFLMECRNPRELAICVTLLNTGLRISELINLELDSLTLFKNENNDTVSTVTVTRKGGKMQEIYFNELVTDCVLKYLKVRKDTQCKNLFVSNTGNPMSTQSIDTTIKKLKNRAGIKKSISAHSLRRSAATNMDNDGFTIDEIQSALGHSSPSTTQIYLKEVHNKAENVFKKFTIGANVIKRN